MEIIFQNVYKFLLALMFAIRVLELKALLGWKAFCDLLNSPLNYGLALKYFNGHSKPGPFNITLRFLEHALDNDRKDFLQQNCYAKGVIFS